ncbi:MAG: hypothetical protein AAFY59_15185, partial [Pseudomonadota bacterium]
SALTGIGASALVLPARPVWAEARSTLTRASRGTVSSCDTAAVMTSEIAPRLSTPADFELAGTCRLTPDTVEGPYFICDGFASQRDVTGGKPGEPMALALRVVDPTCTPIPGAIVDAWGCDAEGWYSGHTVGPDAPNATPRAERGNSRVPDTPERFLRGVLATDADGIAEFDMIYPGFYGQRTIHTHYKVHIGNQVFLTAQALFPEEFTRG